VLSPSGPQVTARLSQEVLEMTLPQTSAGLAQAMDKLAEEAQKEAKRVDELMTKKPKLEQVRTR
jgi:hypothetical protein